MNKKDIMTYLIIAGGAYALYWYLTNYGPGGKVAVAGGKGSYWDSWFGTGTPVVSPAATAAATTAITTTTPPAGTTATSPASNTPPVTPNAKAPATGLRDSLIAAASPATSLTIDQWSYYVNQVSGKPVDGGTVDLMVAAVPDRTTTITADTYISLLTAALSGQTPASVTPSGAVSGHGGKRGVGDITPVPSFQQTTGSGMGKVRGMGRSPWGRMPIPGRYVN